jgi:hypothetical protein
LRHCTLESILKYKFLNKNDPALYLLLFRPIFTS